MVNVIRKQFLTRRRLTALGIFIFSLMIFLFSRVHQVADSKYSMLLAQAVLHDRTFTLDHFSIPRLPPKPQIGYVSNGDIYQLELVNGHIYYFFPPGSSLLSLPYVALMNTLGISAANSDGSYNQRGETALEVGLAALLMSVLVVVIFYTSQWLLSFCWSVLIALGSAFGTQIWSTASRALWSDTWGMFLLGVVLWLLTGMATGRIRPRPIFLATLLAWLYFVRPTYCLSAIAVSIYVLLYYRKIFLPYAIAGLVWALIFVGYSEHEFGRVLPSYYRPGRLSFATFGQSFVGNLVSPSRGLLIFVPILLFIGYLLVRYHRNVVLSPLVVMSLAVIGIHIVVISGFVPWWGGHCYGPRYTSGIVPCFSFIAVIAVRSRLSYQRAKAPRTSELRRTEWAVGAVLLFVSVAMNGIGAMSHRAWQWNRQPINVDERPERVWDWRHPQFLPWI